MKHLTAIAAMACCAWLMVARNGLALSEEVGMLLDRPRNHPYLFFSAEEIPRLRERAQRPTWSDAAAMVIKTAEACLAAEIPPEPEAGPDKPYDEKGGYTTYYLKIHYDFYRAGQQINEIVPSLALAYLLTDDARYLNRAREWLAHFAGWRQWSVKTALADNQSAHSYMGLAIGYDWLWPHLTAAERTRILDGLRRLGETFQKHRGGLAQSALAGRRGGIANNHTWVSHSAPLLGALTQLYESPEAREWLDTEIVCWRDKILPASLGRDGEYVDGAGGWLDYCLQNAIPAFVALKRNGGPDLFRAPGTHLDRVAGFLMRANHWLADDARLPHYPLRYALLALASAYRDSAAQWCALANGLTVANAIKAPTYKGMERERSVPYEANRWTRVRMEWRVDTGRFKTSIDGEAVEDLPMLDRAFASVDRVTFAGHWKTQGDVEIRGIAVMDIGSGRNLDWPRLSALQVGPLQAAENLEVSTPDEAAAEISEDAGHRVLRLRDVSAKTYPTVGFRFTPLKRGAVEFEVRKSDNDKSYAYARLWDGEKELRGVIFYTNGMILKHMPDYKNQDWPFGWRPEASHWFSAVWEFLFYDDSVPARRPERGVPSNVFRDLGWVTMRDTWDAQGMQVFFRSGPEMGKDHGDNNAFRLRAFGEDLLPELATPPSGEKELTQKQYDLLGWFEGTEAHNTIVVDGQTQPAVWGDQTGRQYNAQWLAAPGEGIIPRGKLLSTLFSPFYDYASGDAWNAYTRRQVLLDRFRRDLMFVKSDYVVVFDDIRTKDAVPRAIEWRMHTRSAASIEGNRMLVQGSKAALWATVVAPSVAALSIAQTPAPIEKHRTPYFVLRPREKAPLANFLVVLQPVRERNAPPSDAQAIPADGGVGVQIKAGSQTDTALFATADSASAENIRLTGAAAWVRRGDAGPVAYALHRGTRLDVAGAPLVESTAKLDASVRLEARGASACINLAEPAEVKLLTGKEATKVSVNGKPIAARLDASLRVESLRPDGEGILVLRLEPGTYQVVLQ